MHANQFLSIGQVAARTGVAISALRFYEDADLLAPSRNTGGQRRFLRSDIRRVSFIMIAQQLGFTLAEIRAQMQSLPNHRTPTQKDWQKISKQFRETLDDRINMLERMRDRLDGCIGCGCLSLDNCALYNKEDRARSQGVGPRYIIGDPTDF